MLNTDREARKQSFEKFSNDWLKIQTAGLKPSSTNRLERSIKKLKPFFGKSPISEISRTDCENWAEIQGKGVAAATFNKDLSALKGVLERAVELGYLLDNPARTLKPRKVRNRSILIPTREEFQKLIATLGETDVRVDHAIHLVKLLAYTGMRLGEATEILWKDVDFPREQFTVTGGATGTKNYEVRVVPLFPVLRDFLKELFQKHKPQPSDKIIPIQSARKAMATACKKAELPEFTHHSLRHFFVSNAIEVGIDFKTIAAWIGHKDGGLLVAKTYGHLRDSHSTEMAKRMQFDAT